MPTDTVLLPITDSQKGLLVVDGWVPTRQIYNQVMRFDVDPTLTEDTVAAAIRTLVTIQPGLRQVFRVRPELHAVFAPVPEPAEFPLDQVVAAEGAYDDTVARLAEQLGGRPFDLATGPAYRFAHIRARDGSAAAVLLCGHHLVGDGVSMGPLIRDLELALTGGLPEDAVAAKRQAREAAFAKELQAQNQASRSEQVAERARAWAKQLTDIPPLVLAPRPDRPSETDFAGSRLSWLLSEQETSDLDRRCKRLSVSPFVLLTAVYGAVLARHGGVETVLVGSPFTARRTVRAFDLCGFFVNTLPVTVGVDWTRTVDEHIGTVVREAVDHCKANADVSFNQLVAEVGQDRTSNRNPLFACMLAMQDTYDNSSDGPILGVGEPGNGTAKFDLWLGVTPVNGQWLLELEYDLELIGHAIAAGVLDSLRTALRRAIEDGSRCLAELFVDASLAESQPADPELTNCPAALGDWLSEVALRSPDAVAVEQLDRELTYGELLNAATRVAAGLMQHDTAKHDVVAIATETLCDTVIAILAILRCGATFLPLDLTLPPKRLATMLGRAGCRIVIGDGVDAPGVRTISLAELASPVTEATRSEADPHAAAYLMFTSGSTGMPKGVLMGQRPLRNLAAWQIDALGHDERARFLQYAPLGFDVSFQEIVPTLAAGGTVVSRQPADRRDFPALVRRLAETAVTHAFLPVAALRPFVQAASTAKVRFPSLRHLCVSGEQLLVDAEIRQFFVEHEHCELVNLYGPTETNAATVQRLTGADRDWPAYVPIGRALPGVVCYVVDNTGHLAPVGVPGELYLGGCAPAEGYLGDAERTAAGFVPDHFRAEQGARMYRTGDLVVRDHTGTLTFLGRRDTQLKIRGYRVELGEIEAVANRAEPVAQAVAVARGAGSERELVLFLRATEGGTVDLAEVRTLLTGALPAYMVPSRLFDIDLIPTTRSGKTDRAALGVLADRLVAEQQASTAHPTDAFADDIERDLAALWSAILKVDGVERDRTLLDYGAHSLNVFTAFAEIEQRYGVSVGVGDFFRSPTISSLADLVRADLGRAS
jgi:amino acid adenylation domain-containing protein